MLSPSILLQIKAQAELVRRSRARLLAGTRPGLWQPDPNNRPQNLAFTIEVDELFYGGAGMGGKTQLLIGRAIETAGRALLLRREYAQTYELKSQIGNYTRNVMEWNGHSRAFEWPGQETTKLVRLGGVNLERDFEKFRGIDHDYVGIDEPEHFTEAQVEGFIPWIRTTDKQRKCILVFAGNPPLNPQGQWITRRFAPWVSPNHPNPAKAGEIRYFIKDKDGKERDSHKGETIIHGEFTIRSRSRTFIPASVRDNSYADANEYASTLFGLPEVMIETMLDGVFRERWEDDAMQVIPSAWVDAAMERGKQNPTPPEGVGQSSVGCDVALGGKDKFVLSPLYWNWFDNQIVIPGEKIPTDAEAMAAILSVRRNLATINVDYIGVGAAILFACRNNKIPYYKCDGSAGTDARDKTGHLRFFNSRAKWHWQFREALDPTSGEDIALQPDMELKADLCAPRWYPRGGFIHIEKTEDIKKRLGRSPDKGVSINYAYAHRVQSANIKSRTGISVSKKKPKSFGQMA